MSIYLDHAELTGVASDFAGDISITVTPYHWIMLMAVTARLRERYRWLSAGLPVDDTEFDTVDGILSDLLERMMSAYP